ncbi:hypothetical protein B7494_g5324 [Chlorociboria aeruginascens]|nr:hypothetical protein B7494_g5324 [Chlorociboria aeruginascens]
MIKAEMAPGKRKRNDRTSIDGGENRPSPHRPGNTNLGQHGRDGEREGGRRSSRGGQGGQGRGRRINPPENQNMLNISTRATPTPGPMSPPPPKPSSTTQTPTSVTAELPSPIPKRDLAPFDYVFLTDERIASWDTGGSQEVVAAGIRTRQDEDTMDLGSLFHELIRATLDERIDATVAGRCIGEILGPDTVPDAPTTSLDPQTFFLDTFSMICEAEDGPFNPILRPFAIATGISPVIMRQKLDASLLQSLQLTKDTFIRVGIRQATHLLYRQANYNLLREETEGYSKLVTELYTTSGSEPPSAEIIENAFEKVKGLIGTFDLDVGRVLDITLDVFAAVLIKHYRFFIKLLRASSWWPRNGETDGAAAARCGGLPKWALPSSSGWLSTEEDDELSKKQRYERDLAFWERAREVGLDAFFELGGRQIVDAESKKQIFKGEGDAELDADRQWIEGTGTFPPSGNRTAAQLLGFKLRFYASAARDNDDILPANLIYLTALLIKIGFISLRDLYPHLWPLDEAMPAVRDAKKKELEEKEKLNRPGGGASNALTMAGALADDTLPNGGRPRDSAPVKVDAAKAPIETEDKDKLDEPADQKVQLLVCLLTIGAIPEAMFMLGRFPWLPEAYPELLDLIHRILNHSIQDVYDRSKPSDPQVPECPPKKVADFDQSGVPKGQVRLSELTSRKQLRWPFPDKFDTNENHSYRFYWDEWADNVPVCQSVDDIFTLCATLLNYSGVNIGKDVSLLSKLARIGVKSLSEDFSSTNLDRWQDLLKRLLVPALSLTKANTSVANEIYDMLRFYPVSIRYSIYAEWFEGQISRLPAMKAAFARTRLETLSTMKRISTTNVTAMARTLAKTAYASPGVVFNVALSQIEAYTNLTDVVVECAKYFTDLGYDVLVWSLMSSLGGKDRNRNSAEFALLPSRWLLALSRFSGKVFRRYSIMNLSPIIQYVNNQLYRGNSTDLVILKELIAQMAGVVPDTDFTDLQLVAMTGGELLRRQTLINLQDKRYESTKTAKRLMKALTETKLAGQLLISIAQHRQAAIYSVADDEAHIKMLATMIDDTQLIFFQYLDLLRSNLSIEEFDSQVPDISQLMTDFGLNQSFAFMIGRASLVYQKSKIAPPILNGNTKALPPSAESSLTKINAEGDASMEVEGSKTPNNDQINRLLLSNGESTKDVQMDGLNDIRTSIPDTSPPKDQSQELLEPIITTVQAVIPDQNWEILSAEFYVTFWMSTSGDIKIPDASYNAEISRLYKEQADIMKDRTDMTRHGLAKKEEAKKALAETHGALLAEFQAEVDSFPHKKAQLLKRKHLWFGASKGDLVSHAMLERCLYPRLLLSPSDADFCFKMVKFLHDNGVPNFRTLSLYANLFRANRLRSMIFTCTVREAENLGRFLRSTLADLARWHADASVYAKEALGGNSVKDSPSSGLPGFAKAIDKNGKPTGFLGHDGNKGFKNILLQWHKNLNTALRGCLDGREWMHIRNAITVLKSVVEVFPTIDFMGNGFIKQLENITKREKGVREDLSLTGNAVLVQLKKRSKTWNEPGQANGSPAPASAQLANNSNTVLKPTAPEFKPQLQTNVLTSKVPTTEVEDGEVDDSKNSAVDKASNVADIDPPTEQVKSVALSTTSEPRKSDILVKRDQIRDDSRISTPPPSQSNIPSRPDFSRNVSLNSTHALPNRPDGPFPSRQQLDRHPSRHGDRRDGRDSRAPDQGRLDRPGDRRDISSNDKRGLESNTREFTRPERVPDRERTRPEGPPRWVPGPSRENNDRSMNGSRAMDSGRLSRDNPMPPPRSSSTSERGLLVNPERVPLVNTERQDIINPERAALISGGNDRSNSPHRPRDDTRDIIVARQQSPRRHGTDRDYQDSRREDRSRNAPDLHNSRGRLEDNQLPPAGPRGDRTERTGDRSFDRSRDPAPFQPPPPPREIESNQGRNNPNFGRLNPSPVSDIPSGPRDRNIRTNRMVSTPQQRWEVRSAEPPRPPTPEKQPPTGPSSGRQPWRSASGQLEPISTTASTQVLPLAPPPTPPIHPDRLKHLDPQLTQSQPSTPTLHTPTGVHPDRAAAFSETPTQSPSNHLSNRSRPVAPPVNTTGPPSGPKGSQPSPVSSVLNGLSAPTGPASTVERARRGGRQILGINNIIQQSMSSNGPDRNSRGRGRANANGQPETPVSATSSSASQIPLPPPPPPALARDMQERIDLIAANVPLPEDRPHNDRDRTPRHERSGRHSRRSSKSPDRNRDGKHGPEDDRGPREHRERRGERESNQDRHQNRDLGREQAPSRDLMAGNIPARDLAGRDMMGRDSNWDMNTSGRDGRERDRDRHSSNREPRERESREQIPSWSGSGERGGRRGPRQDGREDNMRGDNDRKRRSDGQALDGRSDKRLRR